MDPALAQAAVDRVLRMLRNLPRDAANVEVGGIFVIMRKKDRFAEDRSLAKNMGPLRGKLISRKTD